MKQNTKKTQDETVEISKFLSLVLRHNPDLIGLRLDSNGWADVDDLIARTNAMRQSHGKPSIDKAKLDEVVRNNDKKRFAYSANGWKIRASQGHSIEVDLKLSPKTPPEFLYHGTARKNLHAVSIGGLKKMNRNHVHLSDNMATATQVGQRYGYPTVLRIKALEMSKDGHDFFLSDNNVWLTDSVPTKYIEVDWK